MKYALSPEHLIQVAIPTHIRQLSERARWRGDGPAVESTFAQLSAPPSTSSTSFRSRCVLSVYCRIEVSAFERGGEGLYLLGVERDMPLSSVLALQLQLSPLNSNTSNAPLIPRQIIPGPQLVDNISKNSRSSREDTRKDT